MHEQGAVGHANLSEVDEARIKYVKYLSSPSSISTACDAARDVVGALPEGRRVCGLDAEWDTPKNSAGAPIGQDSIALVQICFPLEDSADCEFGILLCHVDKMKSLPAGLYALLADSKFTFVGRNVGGDVSKVGRDFRLKKLKAHVRVKDLGTMARERNVVTVGTAALDKIVAVTLSAKVSKDPTVRLSNWSAKPLSDMQQKYAALDPYVSLLAFHALELIPDRTRRLTIEEAQVGAMVDIVPSSGLVNNLGTRSAVGVIEHVGGEHAEPLPHPLKADRLVKVKRGHVVVKLLRVLAPGFIVPTLSIKKQRFSLAELPA
eukprot:3124142-Prymnesium_polylepis.1